MISFNNRVIIVFIIALTAITLNCRIFAQNEREDGYDLWLRYNKIESKSVVSLYDQYISQVVVQGSSMVFDSIGRELKLGLSGMLDREVPFSDNVTSPAIVVGTPESSDIIRGLDLSSKFSKLNNNDGFIICTTSVEGKNVIVITSPSENGVLYGTFRFLALLEQQRPLFNLNIIDQPKIQHRLLNHWDNWRTTSHGSVERGYAGGTIWQWGKLPETISYRYRDYARANASIGINGTVINNVNAQTDYIKTDNLPKVAALAGEFRPYGIKLYLSIRFDSPISLGGLSTADPMNDSVREWWKDKIAEIYQYIPDFGGFLVKGDSEGQPGPLQYGRTHAQGANMLANALEPYDGIVMWRTFVYGVSSLSPDRVKQGYEVFKPLDGEFADNVILQIKNGPLDFQVREPVNPLFGQLENTNAGMELQITQEYTGTNIALCWLIPQWKSVFEFDTMAKGKGSTIKKVINGSLFDRKHSLLAGVANIGSDRNWTGHLLAQANWYGFGRLAWDYNLSTDSIADEWTKMTFSNDVKVVSTVTDMLVNSWKLYESYTSPVGLGFMVERNNRRMQPTPKARQSYHKANKNGVGFDRSRSGNGYVDQYRPKVADRLNDLKRCPEDLLLWIHHVPYNHQLHSGDTLIQAIYDSYYQGVEGVKAMIVNWESLSGLIDQSRHSHVLEKLQQQLHWAKIWRDTCVNYFSEVSGIHDRKVREQNR